MYGVRTAPPHRNNQSETTSIQRAFLSAVRTASASDLDLLLLDVRTEHAIRRLARDIAAGEIRAGQLPLALDLLRTAQEVCS